MAEKIEERVSELERMMKNLAYAHMQTEMSLNSLSEEMRAFKEEMRAGRKSMNKQWGELANKMGTVVEDIVAPNIPRIAREYFHCEIIEDFSVRRKLLNTRDRKTFREFDVIAAGDNLVIVIETKSTPRTEYIDDFARVLGTLFDYLPQYRGYRVIPVFSSLYLDEETVRYLTGKKLYAMGMKDDTMVILNPGLERETSKTRCPGPGWPGPVRRHGSVDRERVQSVSRGDPHAFTIQVRSVRRGHIPRVRGGEYLRRHGLAGQAAVQRVREP